MRYLSCIHEVYHVYVVRKMRNVIVCLRHPYYIDLSTNTPIFL